MGIQVKQYNYTLGMLSSYTFILPMNISRGRGHPPLTQKQLQLRQYGNSLSNITGKAHILAVDQRKRTERKSTTKNQVSLHII